jgi:signal transduction histidine kinase
MLSNVSIGRLDSFKKVYAEKYANGAERSIQQQLQLEFRNFINSEYAYREKRKADLEASLRKTKILSIVFTSVSVFIAIVVIVLLVRRISQRIGTLTTMANSIADGNYQVHLNDIGNDELSSLGNSLNHMASELSRNITLLRYRNEELDQFAHVVSHDLKGPLRGISNVVSWIEEDHSAELSPKLSNYMQLIKGRVLRGENLINGLLAYARADRELAEKEWVDVRQLISEVLDDLPDSGRMAVSVSGMPALFTERILLFLVFSNLIGNAFKHNDKEYGFIRVYWVEHPSVHEFFVEDNGHGIDERYHARIFQIFQTLKERDSVESTGVGLAIVKKILDGKKQQIKLQSRPDSGAIFSFTWPKE